MEFKVGDIIRTRTGKRPAVVEQFRRKHTPAEADAIRADIAAGIARLNPIERDYVVYRTLRDGRPFGPTRSAYADQVRLATNDHCLDLDTKINTARRAGVADVG
ncbi:hypothetical protein [Nocardia salmonicida]|uniref:hypothetical protein n=1 Tax=Nocardia salmonicida TaxID=53431 RepID=UPI003644E62B